MEPPTSSIEPPRRMTLEEWADLDEDETCEIVDGAIVEEEAPTVLHEDVVAWLLWALQTWALPRRDAPGLVTISSDTAYATQQLGRLPSAIWARQVSGNLTEHTARPRLTAGRFFSLDGPFTGIVNGQSFPFEPGRIGAQYNLTTSTRPPWAPRCASPVASMSPARCRLSRMQPTAAGAWASATPPDCRTRVGS